MKRLLVGLVLGMVAASTAQGQEAAGRLTEVPFETLVNREAFKLPQRYGRLASVVVSSDVHYLYFEDEAGTIRVILIGPRGAAARSRSQIGLLSPNVYLMKRELAAP